VFEAKCTAAEVKCIVDPTIDATGPPGTPPPTTGPWFNRLMVLGFFICVLAAMWFGAPRLVWPDRYVPKPTYVRPTSGVSEIDALRPSSFSGQPRGATPAPRPPPRGGPPTPRPQNVSRPQAPPRQPMPGDQTVVIPPRGGARPPAGPSPRPPRPDPPSDRTSSDETIYTPLDPKGPKRPR